MLVPGFTRIGLNPGYVRADLDTEFSGPWGHRELPEVLGFFEVCVYDIGFWDLRHQCGTWVHRKNSRTVSVGQSIAGVI